MFKKIIKFLWRFTSIFSLLALFGLLLSKLIILLYAAPRTFTVATAPVERVAIVFGAGLRYDGTPTAVLRDRVETAAQLYQQGKVNKLLMSGDNRFENYNEPESMRQYALTLGIPDKDIVLDYAGRRTYDTCYRAKVIFQVDSAILVTQGFHLPRALFLCNSFGVKSAGVEVNNIYFRKLSRFIWNVRELFATAQAVWDVYVAKPLPVLGDPEPIN
jgi:vancomycin permeability regulator SanA